jgi:hypothetical protein
MGDAAAAQQSPNTETIMTFLVLSRCAALAAALALTSFPAHADQCDSILESLSKKADTLAKMDAKGAKLCAGMGQLVGLMHAGRIVAEECERASAAKDMAESIKAMEEGIGTECK